ncbi:EamA family transporter [Chiayiivirga flava]|uniref:Multidrug transporter EmrE-like cation transporter n=1 Tax=Chiayiivirga flava TaxID=659595 RepID=A0A7W8D9P9_9GAMM|nr:EamA family transporter [Chiayiivirga flava]MBB5209161.1 multidrug transporter EmrE-like cation transporter [Chiayiivirga flava]
MGYLFVALTVLLTVAGQFLVKWQVGLAGAMPVSLPEKVQFLGQLLLRPWIIVGLGAAFAAALCWMLAMTRLPLSHAYPFTAASFVLVVFGGAWLFSEPVGTVKVLGVGLIVVGVLLIGTE